MRSSYSCCPKAARLRAHRSSLAVDARTRDLSMASTLTSEELVGRYSFILVPHTPCRSSGSQDTRGVAKKKEHPPTGERSSVHRLTFRGLLTVADGVRRGEIGQILLTVVACLALTTLPTLNLTTISEVGDQTSPRGTEVEAIRT
jgi:hypothetical protein